MSFFHHPLWLVGFRPFFLLSCLAGALYPPLWIAIFSGELALTASPVDPLRWHAHEMFFGFGWAVLGGFLLTSTKNWVNIRGYHGKMLAGLAAAWLLERAAMLLGAHWPQWLSLTGSYLFLLTIILLLMWTLIRYRQQDSYRDNALFLLVLPSFLIAKTWLLFGDFQAGYTLCIALFRLAFLIMLERTLTQFMKGIFQVNILRHPGLDMGIKGLALLLLGGFWLPAGLTAGISLLLAVLLGIRFFFWQPFVAMRRIDVGIMYLGYLAIVVQLLLDVFAYACTPVWTGSFAVHLFTLGTMGCVIPAMIMRIAKGHTGRKVVFDGKDRAVLYVMIAALLARTALPQILPEAYLFWLQLSAACWLIAFGTLAIRYIPWLMQPRIDGREH